MRRNQHADRRQFMIITQLPPSKNTRTGTEGHIIIALRIGTRLPPMLKSTT